MHFNASIIYPKQWFDTKSAWNTGRHFNWNGLFL